MRITVKDFFRAAERLESMLDGLRLTTNVWHRHYSVHVLQGDSGCGYLIASGSTAREAYNEVHAAIRALDVNARINELKEKQK